MLTIKVSYFLFYTYVKSSRSTMTWKENLPHMNKFFSFSFFQLLQLLECLSGYMCGDNLTMKFPPDFHNYTGLNVLVNSFPWFTIATPNELILGCKLHWSAKRKKTTCEKWFLGDVLQNSFSRNFSKFTEKHLCVSLFLTLLKVFMPSGLQLFKRKTSSLGFQSKPFVDPLENRCSWIIYKIHRNAPEFEFLFK